MSFRVGFALAVVLLLLAAILRIWNLPLLPVGLNDGEITDIRVTETARQGTIEVFYDLGGEGREGLYHIVLAVVTGVIGNGQFGYHIFSVWVSLLTLVLVYALVTRLYGPRAGIAALALLTVNFFFILAGREVSREILLPGLTAAIMLLLARGLAVYKAINPRLPLNTIFAALGFLLGVGFYIHPSHFFIVLFSILFIVYRLMNGPKLSEQTMGYLRFSLLVMVIVATPYLISSIRLPQLSGFQRLWGDYDITHTSPFTAYLNGLGGLLFMGDTNPVYNLPGRPLIDLGSGLLVLVGLLAAIRAWRAPRYALPLIAAACLSPVVFLANDSPDFPQYLIFLPLIALFFGLGVSTLYKTILTANGRRLAWVGFLALFVFNLAWVIPDFYRNWPALPDVYTAYRARLGQIAHHLDMTADEIPPLICDVSPRSPDTLRDTDLILLMMNRENVNPRFADCGSGFVFISGGEGQQVVLPEANTLSNMHPYLRQWVEQGEMVEAPNFPPDAIVNLMVADELADRVGRFTTTAPAGYAPEAPGDDDLVAPPVQFGDNLTFLGYEEKPTTDYTPGGIVTSITYWRADGVLPPSVRLFTHVLADPAAIAAQTDTISVDVRQLQPRDVFIQITFVPLPFSIPEGVYSLSVGAYKSTTNERLHVLDDGQPRGDRLFLGQITIRRTGN